MPPAVGSSSGICNSKAQALLSSRLAVLGPARWADSAAGRIVWRSTSVPYSARAARLCVPRKISQLASLQFSSTSSFARPGRIETHLVCRLEVAVRARFRDSTTFFVDRPRAKPFARARFFLLPSLRCVRNEVSATTSVEPDLSQRARRSAPRSQWRLRDETVACGTS